MAECISECISKRMSDCKETCQAIQQNICRIRCALKKPNDLSMSQIMPQMCISEFVWMHVRFRLSKSTSQGGHHLRQSIRIPQASIPCLDHDVQGVSFWVVVTQIKQIHFHTSSWWAVAMATDGLQHFLFSPTQHHWILPFTHMILAMALTLDPLNRNKNCKIKIHRHTSYHAPTYALGAANKTVRHPKQWAETLPKDAKGMPGLHL